MQHGHGPRSRSCDGKRRHETFQAAARSMAHTGQVTGQLTLIVYRCDWCDGYHVGHPPRAEQRQLRYERLLRLIDKANGR